MLFLPALIALHFARSHFPAHSTQLEKTLLVAAVAACLVSTLLADQPARAAATLSAWILTGAGGVIAARLAGHALSIRIVLAGMATSALIGLVVVRIKIEAGAGVPLYGHARLLGIHLLIGSVAALGLWHTMPGHRRRHSIIAAISACALAAGTIWSGGRAPLLGFAVGLVMWLWLCPRLERWPLIRRVGLMLIFGLALAISLGSPHPMMGWNYSVARTLQADSINALSSTRIEFWSVTFDHFTLRPWFGHGADSYLFIRPSQTGAQPHNFILQWFVDFGVVGTVILSGLLGVRLFKGLASAGGPLNSAALFGAIACTTAALLDGGFYHAFLFMPAVVLLGFSIGAPKTKSANSVWLNAVSTALVIIASLTITLNGWLYYRLKATPPHTPHSMAAILLRAFPSNLNGLWFWLDAWKKDDPDIALEWAIWAQSHAIHPELFGIYAARCHLEQKNFTASEAELRKILPGLSPDRRKPIQKMINEVRRQAFHDQAKP
jgi:O-antigen ligase